MNTQALEIKRGMFLRCKGKCPFFAIATSDEYEDAEKWRAQQEYWGKLEKQLNGRQTMVDVVHFRATDGEIKPISKKPYTYPSERVKPLTAEKINQLLGKLDKPKVAGVV